MHKANKRTHDFEASVIRLPRGSPPALGAVSYSKLSPHFCAHGNNVSLAFEPPSHLQLWPMTYPHLALTSRSFPALNISVHTVSVHSSFYQGSPSCRALCLAESRQLDDVRAAGSVLGLAKTAATFQCPSFQVGICIFPSEDHLTLPTALQNLLLPCSFQVYDDKLKLLLS